MKMSCKDIEKYAVDYFDNNLDNEKRVQFENHLKTCTECTAMIEAQRKWLTQHRHTLNSQENLSEDDLIKYKDAIMDSVKSSQQVERAAKYIYSYQHSQQVDTQIEPKIEQSNNNKKKIALTWLKPGMIAKYAVMLVLIVMVGFLIRAMINNNGVSRSIEQENNLIMQDAIEIDDIFENEQGLPEIYNSDNFSNDKNIEENAGSTEAATESDLDNGGMTNPDLKSGWQIFNGKLTDLANVSPIFEGRESIQTTSENIFAEPEMETSAETTNVDAVTTVDLFSTAKAIRILTKRSVQEDSLNPVTEILVLATWQKAKIDEQFRKLESLLESSQSSHTLRLINDRMKYESIKELIGTAQYDSWMQQIEENSIENYSWISLKIGG